MSAHAGVHEANHTTRFNFVRYSGVVLAVLCAAFVAYAAINVVGDYSLVKGAFPSLSAELTTDMDVSILLSPVMLLVDRSENYFLQWIKYPPLTLPNATPPTRNTIGDEIQKAQKEQDLLRLDDVLAVDDIMEIKESSIEAVGRAIYLSQERPAAMRLEQGKAALIGDAATERAVAIKQLRQIFEIAYGEKALQQVIRPEK